MTLLVGYRLQATAALPDHSSSCNEEHRRCVRDPQFQNCKLRTFDDVFNETERKIYTAAIISWLEKCSWVKSSNTIRGASGESAPINDKAPPT